MVGAIVQRVRSTLHAFHRDERGVVTIEYVALGGAVLIGAITVGWLVLNSLQQPSSTIGTNITNCETSAAGSGGGTTGCQ